MSAGACAFFTHPHCCFLLRVPPSVFLNFLWRSFFWDGAHTDGRMYLPDGTQRPACLFRAFPVLLLLLRLCLPRCPRSESALGLFFSSILRPIYRHGNCCGPAPGRFSALVAMPHAGVCALHVREIVTGIGRAGHLGAFSFLVFCYALNVPFFPHRCPFFPPIASGLNNCCWRASLLESNLVHTL